MNAQFANATSVWCWVTAPKPEAQIRRWDQEAMEFEGYGGRRATCSEMAGRAGSVHCKPPQPFAPEALGEARPGAEFGTTEVHLRERKTGFSVPKRHQMKHLDFYLLFFGTRGSEVQIHFGREVGDPLCECLFQKLERSVPRRLGACRVVHLGAGFVHERVMRLIAIDLEL